MCVSSRISNPHCIGTVLLAYKKRIIISKFFSRSNKTKGVLIAESRPPHKKWMRSKQRPGVFAQSVVMWQKVQQRLMDSPQPVRAIHFYKRRAAAVIQVELGSQTFLKNAFCACIAQWRATRANKGDRLFLSKPI